MAAKRSKAPTDDELGELFSGIGDDSGPKKSSKAKPTGPKARGEKQEEKDILAELENQLEDQPVRPHTPRIKEPPATSKQSPAKRTSTATPPPAGRLSEDKSNVPRKSADSQRSFHASFTPSATSAELSDAERKAPSEQAADAPAAGAGGGWWGGIFATASATASAAMKQAEAAYKEIQQNEDAKKWAEQVKGNVGVIRGLGKWDMSIFLSLSPSLPFSLSHSLPSGASEHPPCLYAPAGQSLGCASELGNGWHE